MTIRDVQDYIKRNLKDESGLLNIRIQDDSICDDGDSILLYEVYLNGNLYANYLAIEEASDLVIAIVDGYNLGKGNKK